MAVTEAHLDPTQLGVVLETGGASPLVEFLAGQYDVFQTEVDLRLSLDAADASVDLVLSLEVLEHLKDRPDETFDEMVLFRSSGALTYASEIARVLRPGGPLILTSPNALAAINLLRLLEGVVPMVYRPHVREYTRAEIVALFPALEVVHQETCFNFFLMADGGRNALDRIEAAGGIKHDRGDDDVFVFRKPGKKT